MYGFINKNLTLDKSEKFGAILPSQHFFTKKQDINIKYKDFAKENNILKLQNFIDARQKSSSSHSA